MKRVIKIIWAHIRTNIFCMLHFFDTKAGWRVTTIKNSDNKLWIGATGRSIEYVKEFYADRGYSNVIYNFWK